MEYIKSTICNRCTVLLLNHNIAREISAEFKATTRVVALERQRQPGAQKYFKTDATWVLYN